jgi:sugar/nucleoside kinase (ribokinase family)
VSAARRALSWGPSAVVAKQGEHGAALITQDGFFSVPALPLERVVDPTGAGDTFAGGFVGCLARDLDSAGDEDALRRAMAHGTALASFNVEEFGTDRVARLTADELHERVCDLRAMTRLPDLRVRAITTARSASHEQVR